ncbi:hypothetical protein Pelo_16831 [Pelomyxa schiedti]|nr:hypothetical protein Pelo_16831 [Pelomyxa schiedti]
MQGTFEAVVGDIAALKELFTLPWSTGVVVVGLTKNPDDDTICVAGDYGFGVDFWRKAELSDIFSLIKFPSDSNTINFYVHPTTMLQELLKFDPNSVVSLHIVNHSGISLSLRGDAREEFIQLRKCSDDPKQSPQLFPPRSYQVVVEISNPVLSQRIAAFKQIAHSEDVSIEAGDGPDLVMASYNPTGKLSVTFLAHELYYHHTKTRAECHWPVIFIEDLLACIENHQSSTLLVSPAGVVVLQRVNKLHMAYDIPTRQ